MLGTNGGISGNDVESRPIQNDKVLDNHDSFHPPYMKILELHVSMDKYPTKVDENTSNVLMYQTPSFRAAAVIKFPNVTDQTQWRVGWIQACHTMKFHNLYSYSSWSSWEFPEMVAGQKAMINDSDGHSYPFYGDTNFVKIQGPCPSSRHRIQMVDFFNPWVPWEAPQEQGPRKQLREIVRNQSFLVWLVAFDTTRRSIYIFKTISWEMDLKIAVDMSKPQGQRTRLVSKPLPNPPIIYDENMVIPTSAIYPPSANHSQVLVWRSNGELSLLVSPRFVVLDEENYACLSRHVSEASYDGRTTSHHHHHQSKEAMQSLDCQQGEDGSDFDLADDDDDDDGFNSLSFTD